MSKTVVLMNPGSEPVLVNVSLSKMNEEIRKMIGLNPNENTKKLSLLKMQDRGKSLNLCYKDINESGGVYNHYGTRAAIILSDNTHKKCEYTICGPVVLHDARGNIDDCAWEEIKAEFYSKKRYRTYF